jgi:hypothetical protein
LRDPKKHRLISGNTRELNLAFISILETGRSNFTDAALKNLCAGKISYDIAKLLKAGLVVFWWGRLGYFLY